MPDTCCVPGCKKRRISTANKENEKDGDESSTTTETEPALSFFTLPNQKLHPEQREKWINIIMKLKSDWKNDSLGERSRVCGLHFVTGK